MIVAEGGRMERRELGSGGVEELGGGGVEKLVDMRTGGIET
jgi:hypothetical protein